MSRIRLCINCNKAPINPEPVAYQDLYTLEILRGHSNHCSKECRLEYAAKMDLKYPNSGQSWVEIEP